MVGSEEAYQEIFCLVHTCLLLLLVFSKEVVTVAIKRFLPYFQGHPLDRQRLELVLLFVVVFMK